MMIIITFLAGLLLGAILGAILGVISVPYLLGYKDKENKL